MDTKAQRIERLTIRLLKLFKKYKIPPDTDLGETCLSVGATMLEHHVNKRNFLERAAAWWDLVTSTQVEEPPYTPLKTMEQSAREMAETIRVMTPPGSGFALVVYNFGAKGNMTYMSTGDRNDTISMLKELTGRLVDEREKGDDGALRS